MRNALAVGGRVYLRALDERDASELAGLTAGETEVFFLGRGRLPLSPQALAEWIRRIHALRPPETLEAAVCRVEDDRLLGYVGVWEIDWARGTGEVDIALWPASLRGRGYGSEALGLLLDLVFGQLQLHVLRAFVWSTNDRSTAALRRAGFRAAGHLRTTVVKGGLALELLAFDLTAVEWLQRASPGSSAGTAEAECSSSCRATKPGLDR